jgi:Ca2+-binding RTX toxin-like protein
LIGKPGNDTLYGDDGDDVMHGSLDGERDQFFCGPGTDTVEADGGAEADEVADDCERVHWR